MAGHAFFQPCIPTAGKAVPVRPEWLHEVRLIVVREDLVPVEQLRMGLSPCEKGFID
jgi:hypothetical protein